MDDWRSRIGSAPWRNLISEECRVVSDAILFSSGETRQGQVEIAIPPLPNKASLCYLPLTSPAGNPYLQSYLVFQTGRLFLVGVPEGAVEALKRTSPFSPPSHIVLLTWEENHIRGLLGLLDLYQNPDFRLTIWTSSWIWEEALRWLSSQDDKRVRLLERLRLWTPEEVEASIESAGEPELRAKVVVCERHMDLRLALGVRLRMGYVPSVRPSLQVSFHCNHLEISINPLNTIKSLDQLTDVRERLKTGIRSFHSIKDDFSVRYGNLEESCKDGALKNSEIQSQFNKGWQLPEPRKSWMFREPVDLEMIGETIRDIRFVVAPTTQHSTSSKPEPQITPDTPVISEEEAKDILSKTVVAILCGGLGAKRQKDLLTPSRRLSVSNAKNEMRVLSILEWHLHQIYQWVDRYGGEDLPVLLMTSPDTEELVHELAARFEDLVQTEKKLLRFVYLPQQLVPRVEKTKGKLLPLELPDGGWMLDARGHLDILRLLRNWTLQEGTCEQRSLSFVIPYNNLGRLFDDHTLSTLLAFRNAGRMLGVELFRFAHEGDERRPLGMRDPRWDLMSYAAKDVSNSSFYLLKKAYFAGERKRLAREFPISYSSHVWYMNLEKIKGLDEEFLNAKPLNSYIIEGKKGPWFPRQDLEQVTHFDNSQVIYISEMSLGNPERVLYSHLRFVTARTEDHIRQPHFRKAFDEAFKDAFPPKGETDLPIGTGDSPFLEMVPAEMPYVWGGHIIRTLKRLPRGQRIAETWEVSTHPSGPSLVYPNLRQPTPLPEVLRRFKDSEDGHLPFMAKYLDCHDPLSVQVHPNHPAAKYLCGIQGLQLQDEFGKEESFYVIEEAAHHKLHLFLGFDRENLTPIAQFLRPILLAYVGATSRVELWECYNELVAKLRERFAEQCIGDIATVLSMDAEECGDIFLSSLKQDEPEGKDFRSLQKVFRYHVETGSNHMTESSYALSLLGKEYLFAAIGIIRLIEEIAAYVLSQEKDQRLQKDASMLFDYRILGVKEIDKTFLKYFRKQEIRKGGWGRVPSGIVHSWQGGGNFLIELAQRSDNTFRILDFGRELSSTTRREMHYLQAMYSLSADGILDEESSKRFLFDVTTTNPRSLEQYHSDLSCKLFSAGSDGQAIEASGWSALMNPDNPVRIRTDTERGERFSELSVKQCRAILVQPGTRARVLPTQSDDRLLFISPRLEREDLVCVSLSATKIEVALYRDGESPPIIWCKGSIPKQLESESNHTNMIIDATCNCISELAQKLADKRDAARGRKRMLRVAVSWPGYIKQAGEDGQELYSSNYSENELKSFPSRLFKKISSVVYDTYQMVPESKNNPLILNDAAVSALGEYHHPLGRLPEDIFGAALNIGSGLCVGFYTGKITLVNAKRKQALTACSAVGRWLYIDPRTGQMRHPFPEEDMLQKLQSHVFRGQVPYRWEGSLRTSVYLSSRGIALRFLSRLPDPEEFLSKAKIGWNSNAIIHLFKQRSINKQRDNNPVDRFLKGCETIAANPESFNLHKMIYQINAEAMNRHSDRRNIARELIIEVAQEIAEVVLQTGKVLERVVIEYPDQHGDPQEALRKGIKRVVLTGAVGEHFGWLGTEDLLLEMINRCLNSSQLKELPKVERSEVSISCIREIEGFRHFLATYDNSGRASENERS